MDTRAKPDVRLPETRTPRARHDGSKVQRVNRWLIGAVAVLGVALVALGTWAIVDRPSEAGSEEVTTTRPAATEPKETEPAATKPAVEFDMADPIRMADREAIRFADGAIAAYNRGAPDHRFRGGFSMVDFDAPWLYRYDRADGTMVEAERVRQAVGARHVERIGPVVLVAGTPTSEMSEFKWGGSYTVAFSVRAGGEEQVWLQRWEPAWGEVLAEMWVF